MKLLKISSILLLALGVSMAVPVAGQQAENESRTLESTIIGRQDYINLAHARMPLLVQCLKRYAKWDELVKDMMPLQDQESPNYLIGLENEVDELEKKMAGVIYGDFNSGPREYIPGRIELPRARNYSHIESYFKNLKNKLVEAHAKIEQNKNKPFLKSAFLPLDKEAILSNLRVGILEVNSFIDIVASLEALYQSKLVW